MMFKWRADYLDAVYMSDMNLRFVTLGRDTERNQNQVRLYDFKEGTLKHLY